MATENTKDGSEETAGLAKSLRLRSFLESIIERVDGSQSLNRLGQGLTELVGKVVKPGKTKDLLSGTWMGHPVHPMLTDLPIGSWTSSFFLDMLGDERVNPASDTLVAIGIVTALPTAVTGLSDLADVGEDEGLRVGTAHALGNTAALICYTASFAARKSGNRRSGIAWSTAGATFATIGGYFGGHMAYRRGIGVNQTAFRKPVDEWTQVLDSDGLPEGEPRMVRLEGDDLLLYRSGEKVFALANRCSHRGGPLNEGEIKDGAVTCPLHMSTFKLEDGSVLNGPATAPQPCYEARVNDGKVEVRSR